MSEAASLPARLRRIVLLALFSLPAVSPAQALSDPTAPLPRSERAAGGSGIVHQAPTWLLQSIMVGPSRRVAVINGEIVREGVQVAGATVLAIEPTSVLLDAGGRRLRLRLFDAAPALEDSRGTP